jgi:hypothetical protein
MYLSGSSPDIREGHKLKEGIYYLDELKGD